MSYFTLFARLARLPRWQKLVFALGCLAFVEGLVRGAALWLGQALGQDELRERLADLPPNIRAAGDFVARAEPVLLGLAALFSAVLLLWQLYWSLQQWPAALQRRQGAGYLLEVLPATDSTVRYTAMASLLTAVRTMLQAREPAVLAGRATTLSLEYWSTGQGTRLCCWLPGQVDQRLLNALAEQLRAAYPGVRLRRSADPLRDCLSAALKAGRAPLVGVTEYRLRASADYPLREPEGFPGDPLAPLVAALQAEPGTTVVGLQIVLTAYSGAWRASVDGRLAALRAREAAVARKTLLPASHAAELRALERQRDQPGFETLLRAVVVGSDDGSSSAAVAARLDRISGQLEQYDGMVGAIRQGFVSAGRVRRGSLQPGEGLPDWVRAALYRWPRPLGPLGRRLQVIGARELAALWHLPTRELRKLPGLNCWQRAEVFAAPSGVRVPDGAAARDWMITGVVPRELAPPGSAPQYLGLRRAALNQHIYVNGPTRSGKTKLLENLTRQDLEGGHGAGVIDPKGDYARKAILMVPPQREGEVCYFDPLDPNRRVMGVNPLERAAVKRLGRDVVQSGAISILGSLGAGWEGAPLGKRFMQHALALLLDAEPEPTFLQLYRLLQHTSAGNPYREELLARASSQTGESYSLVAADFWGSQVPGMKEAQLGSLQTALTRTETFLANERVLQIVAQPASTFRLRELMDNRGIFVAAVTAELGGDLQRFVGSLLMTLITQAGFSRNDLREGEREFWRLTVDEFQKFIAMAGAAEQFEDLLSMLGGLGVGLTLAHQAFKQLDGDLLGVILGNVGTRIFYPSQEDAAAIAARLGGQVRKEDQLYLERFWTTQVLPMASGSSGPVSAAPLPLAPPAADPAHLAAVPEAVLQDPLVRCWGRARVPLDELPSGALRDLASAWPAEDDQQRGVRLSGLVEALYGAERDEQVVSVLCALSGADFALYRRIRRAADQHLREQLLAHPRLLATERSEESKLRRVALLSDLRYGTPPVEVRAQIERVLGHAWQADPEAALGAARRRNTTAEPGRETQFSRTDSAPDLPAGEGDAAGAASTTPEYSDEMPS